MKKQQQQFRKSLDASATRMDKENNQQDNRVPAIKVPETTTAAAAATSSNGGGGVMAPPTTHDIPDGLDAVELGQQVSELEIEVATLRASLAGHERVMREQARENQRLSIVEREAKRDSFKSEETK